MTSTTNRPPLSRREARAAERLVAPTPPTAPVEPPPPPRPKSLPEKGERRTGLRSDIQGLRAIAILLVVLYHCAVPGITGGFVGVDVFFVISGFLITGHLAREATTTGQLRIGRFYGRRIVRLLPAATMVIGATLAASWYWAPATRAKALSWDALSANLYWINYRLIETGTEYRNADAAPSPLQHFWSLAVEEQFYLLIPLLVLLTAVVLKSRTALLTAIAAVTAASLYWSIATTGSSPIWAYFGIPTRAWELGVGALLALGAAQLMRVPQLGLVALRYAGIAAIAYAAYAFTDATAFPSYTALLPVLGAAAVIAGGQRHSDDPVLGNPAFLFIGARSYSWYLWHWPFLMLAPYALSRELNLPIKLAVVAAALVAAMFTYEVFEHPMQSNKELRDRPKVAFKLGAILTALVVAAAIALPFLPARQPLGLGTVAELTLNGSGSAQEKALMAQVSAATKMGNLPLNLTPKISDAPTDWPVVYADGCHLTFKETSTPRHCEKYGDAKSKTLIALYGDSHAAQWFPALNRVAKEKGWRLADFTKSACSSASITMYLPANKGAYGECDQWRDTTIARMNKLKPALIVIASNWGGYANGLNNNDPGTDAVWLKAYEKTIQRLTIPGTKLAYMNDSPWPKQVVPDCLATHVKDVQECGRTFKSANSNPRRQKVVDTFKKADVPVIDPMPWFCTLSSCPPVIGNYLVYMDGSHVTPEYARLLAPVLGEQLPTVAAAQETKATDGTSKEN